MEKVLTSASTSPSAKAVANTCNIYNESKSILNEAVVNTSNVCDKDNVVESIFDEDGDVVMDYEKEKGTPMCSTPVTKSVPSFRARMMRRPLNLKAPRPLKMNDSGFKSFSAPGPVVTLKQEDHGEDDWENKTFNSEDSTCEWGTQTSFENVVNESKTANLTR